MKMSKERYAAACSMYRKVHYHYRLSAEIYDMYYNGFVCSDGRYVGYLMERYAKEIEFLYRDTFTDYERLLVTVATSLVEDDYQNGNWVRKHTGKYRSYPRRFKKPNFLSGDEIPF